MTRLGRVTRIIILNIPIVEEMKANECEVEATHKSLSVNVRNL